MTSPEVPCIPDDERPIRPTSDLVAKTWLKLVVPPNVIVATQLPKNDMRAHSMRGFVTAVTVGGNIDAYVPVRSPTIQVDCYFGSLTSEKSPWHLANGLAEYIIDHAPHHIPVRSLTLPEGYADVHVRDFMAAEPRRMPNDEHGIARYMFEADLVWSL